jgi:2-polyprenyl-3-methyl-5-hydroxy-6-metoxy-1,4-benzoquinol methylase
MSYSQKLRNLFPDIALNWEDILLLESFQIKYFPDRIAVKEFAILLHTYPVLYRFLVSKYPPIKAFLTGILEENDPVVDKAMIEEQCQEALWEIADLIIYNKHPEQFDAQAPIRWEIDEITSITSLEGKVVADVGAGSGRIAFMVASHVLTVFAVEPLASFRTFMKEKALEKGMKNIFITDGTLDSIPLPDKSLDVLLTSNAIGWKLEEELQEIERVLRSGGHAIHLLRSTEKQEFAFHQTLISSPWDYICQEKESVDQWKLIYHKNMKH